MSSAYGGQYLDPTSRTNVNEIDPLFETSVDDYKSFEQSVDSNRGRGIEAVKSKSGFNDLAGNENAETEANNLSQIRANDLESKGREEYAKNPEVNDYFVDYSKPGMKQHKEDAEEVAKASGKLMNSLFDKLKEVGVDCKTVKGNKEIEPEYFIEPDRSEVKEQRMFGSGYGDTVYDKFYCEQLRNSYNCHDSLNVRCADAGFVPGRLTNVTGNMIHTLDGNGTLTIGVNKTAYFYNAWGSQHDFSFSFNIENAKGIDSFKLLKIDWADYVLVKLNDNIVFQGPFGNGKIEMSQDPAHYRVGPDDERYFGVDLGTGDYVPANTKRYYTNSPNVEARQFLRDGVNNLNIRLVYGKGGKIWTQVKFTERVCRNWVETWDEKCSIN